MITYRAIEIGATPAQIGVLGAVYALLPLFLALFLGKNVGRFGEASGPFEVQLLLAAGFFLFLMTLVVNMIANLIVSRSGRLKK